MDFKRIDNIKNNINNALKKVFDIDDKKAILHHKYDYKTYFYEFNIQIYRKELKNKVTQKIYIYFFMVYKIKPTKFLKDIHKLDASRIKKIFIFDDRNYEKIYILPIHICCLENITKFGSFSPFVELQNIFCKPLEYNKQAFDIAKEHLEDENPTPELKKQFDQFVKYKMFFIPSKRQYDAYDESNSITDIYVNTGEYLGNSLPFHFDLTLYDENALL